MRVTDEEVDIYTLSQRLQGGMGAVSVEQLLHTLPARQKKLEEVVRLAIEEASFDQKPHVIANGHKNHERAVEKTRKLLRGDIAQLHDLSRLSILVASPEDSELILDGLEKQGIPLVRLDWHIGLRGNIRRKIYAVIPDESGREYISEIGISGLFKFPGEISPQDMRELRGGIYRLIRQMGNDKGLVDIQAEKFKEKIYPEFLSIVEYIRNKLPDSLIIEGLKQGHDLPKDPEGILFIMLNQSKFMMHQVIMSQSKEWQELEQRLNEGPQMFSDYLRR